MEKSVPNRTKLGPFIHHLDTLTTELPEDLSQATFLLGGMAHFISDFHLPRTET